MFRHPQPVEPLTSDEVRVWHAGIDVLPEERAPTIEAWLTPGERDRYARYRSDADRSMFLLGRILARTLVARTTGLAPDAWRWHEGPRGRPEMADVPSPVRFNIAHSGGMVVCAVAATREVGVDVEDRHRHAAAPALIERCCSTAEIAHLNELRAPDRQARFFDYWTLKEAYLKARGLGVSVRLADISFHVSPPAPSVTFSGSLATWSAAWEFRLMDLTDRHVMAVAVEAAPAPSRFVIRPMPLDVLA